MQRAGRNHYAVRWEKCPMGFPKSAMARLRNPSNGFANPLKRFSKTFQCFHSNLPMFGAKPWKVFQKPLEGFALNLLTFCMKFWKVWNGWLQGLFLLGGGCSDFPSSSFLPESAGYSVDFCNFAPFFTKTGLWQH